MKKTGVVLLAIGAIITILTSLNFSFNNNEGDVNSGQFNISPRHARLSWPPFVGMAIMVIGGGAYLLGLKRSLTQL